MKVRFRQQLSVALVVLAALSGVSCAARTPPTGPTTLSFPDFVFPAVPPGLGNQAETDLQRAAWHALQAGDLRSAERGFGSLLGGSAGFYPASAGLGYVELARRAPAPALSRFEAALSKAPGYAPALAGRGEALLASDRPGDALASFESALRADPNLPTVRARVEVLRFRVVEAETARARRAAGERRFPEAQQAYEQALSISPTSAYLHRELAVVTRERGHLDEALVHARRAVELDSTDARAYATLGDILVARGESVEALAAFERADVLDPSDALKTRMAEIRGRTALDRLPPEYRAIHQARALTRGDLAALTAVRLNGLLEQARTSEGVLITDTRGHWAAAYILTVARAGVMEVYPNHTFQPSAILRRGELASVVSRLLDVLMRSRPVLAERWSDPKVTFTDLPPGHLSYPAAALAVSSGVMPMLDGSSFQLSRVVSGPEAMGAIERIEGIYRSTR